MAKATWSGATLAESEHCEVVEGNLYFPADSLRREHFLASDTRTTCPWKGEAHYFHIQVGDDVNRDAAWYYPAPKPAAAEIQDHVAFWRGVTVEA